MRLKGGDPSVFGRLEEELRRWPQAGIECEVVPGVTAALAAAAATQRPLTRRGSGRSVEPHHRDDADRRAARQPRTPTPRCSTWPGKQLAALSRRLLAAGWPADTPVLVVSRAGWPDQLPATTPSATLAQASVLHAGRPTVVTVGAGAARERRPRADAPATASSRPLR